MASGPDMRLDDRPVRGTRPGNRRELIVVAAAKLFYAKGFARTSMGEIAEAVSIGPSALYRHFRGKGELLTTVVDESIISVRGLLEGLGPDRFGQLSGLLAPVLLEHREMGVMWRRESRNLDEEVRARAHDQIRAIAGILAEVIEEGRQDLGADDAAFLASCLLGVATSISFHQLTLPEEQFTELLASMLDGVLTTSLPAGVLDPDSSPMLLAPRKSRREDLLAAAIRLFSEDGYAKVGMEDIGAAVGIAGPSVYSHFGSKAELLIAGTVRATEWLRMDLAQALARATDPEDGLRRLLLSYSAFALANPHMVDLLVTELDQLPAEDRLRARQSQLDYIAEWVHLLRAVHTELDAVTARILVQATLSMMNDVALIPRLRARGGLCAEMAAVGERLLALH
ncbi:TetR/AcrR family transcriptional regulator [Rhodococcus sp. ARC_M6]|uniref:TetR/AcrR family transcriptional regulator n=1 Tax=Rhodococcus sp. ARC_M6 TaxID=2928852 RepID=UPI001FB4A7EB|nr:TetR/AcrR family transcriptional regulator [Rhodococcus sp. ARC_M6]MCJ0907284.1 TetR/AcrR family transcriptional regulator [Rhodococcus sp. ARC_M6]